MMKSKRILQLLITSLLFLSLVKGNVYAFTMGSSLYSIESGNFEEGGGAASSANYLVNSVAGEDYLSTAVSPNFINNPGLAFLPSATPTPTVAPTSASSSSSSTSNNSSTPTGQTSTTISNPSPTPISRRATQVPPIATNPSQLFDIALVIDQPLIDDSHKLAARVTFASFGKEATSVDMTFIILDGSGKQLYRTTGKTTIQTEGVYNQAFKDLNIPDGKYTLLLNTLYNVNVKDEFRQPFEVKSQKNVLTVLWPWGLFIAIPVLLLVVIFLWKRHRKHRI